MELLFQLLTQIHALEIANEWKYPDIDSFYDMTADAENHEAFVNKESIGFQHPWPRDPSCLPSEKMRRLPFQELCCGLKTAPHRQGLPAAG